MRKADGTEVMRLRVLIGRLYAASIECWVLKPLLRVSAQGGADNSVPPLCDGTREWLREHSVDCEPKAKGLLHELASGALEPPGVRIRRRQLRSALPGEKGVLLEQSDVSSEERLWRSVLIEGCSPVVCHRAVLDLRERCAVAAARKAPCVSRRGVCVCDD